ncbi:MAG: RNA methyltransferase [Candidatus Moranbacteria bacterium]|nr:RNA methyltransferase [Candidatus Moranbacteria bacterium]
MKKTEDEIRPLTKDEIRSGKVCRNEFHKLKRNPISLVLDGLKCAHNVGTILRLSDALLVEKVFICGDAALPPSRKVRKGSLGAERWIDWEHRENAFDTVLQLKEKGVCIVTAEIATISIDYRNADYQFPVCLVLGREDRGVSQKIIALSDAVVHLPMYGMVNSLNVSTVAAVLMYDLIDKLDQIASGADLNHVKPERRI